MEKDNTRRFSDVFSAIVNSCSKARSSTDLAALRIAEQYKRNELLKGLPVPRLRFHKINISMPVVITDLIPEKKAKMNSIDVIVEKIDEKMLEFSNEVFEAFQEKNKYAFLSDDEKEEIIKFLNLVRGMNVENTKNDRGDDLERVFDYRVQIANELKMAFYDFHTIQEYEERNNISGENALSDFTIMSKVEKITIKIIGNYIKTIIFQAKKKDIVAKGEIFNEKRARASIEKIMKQRYIVNFLNSLGKMAGVISIVEKTVSADFEVIVDTDNVKNSGGGSSSITRIEMTLFEEGLEWVCENNDGVESTRLMKE